MRRRNKQEVLNFLKEKISSYSKYLLIFGVVILAISLIKNIIRTINIRNRIKNEEKKVEVLRKEKEELEKEVAEVESDAYVEKQLRDKLGLAKEGEIVLILPEDEILRKIAPILEEEEDLLPDPTWKKWLKLFI